MKQLEFYKSLNNMQERECIEKFLIYNASLVISGLKPSATVTIKKDCTNLYKSWIKYGIEFLKNINIKYIELRECDNALIILVYDEENLKKCIFKSENKRFLMKLGYIDTKDINEYLLILKNRYKKFNCPHELGIFLGFPLNDVKDFMECTEKKCLSCGYWLVYNDLKEAKELFDKYDKIKDFTINYILNGNSSSNVVINIKRLFNGYEKVSV